MFVAKLPIPTCKHWSQQKTHTCVSSNKVKHPTNKQKQHMGVCKKKTRALSNGFSKISFFPSYRFSKRWLHTLIKEFT
jgi:hypothetical protein